MERKKGVNSIRHHRNYDFGIVPQIDFKVLVDKNIIRMILWIFGDLFWSFLSPFLPNFSSLWWTTTSGIANISILRRKETEWKVANKNSLLLVFCWKVGELLIQKPATKSCLIPDVVLDWEMESGYSTPCTSQQIASLSFNLEDIYILQLFDAPGSLIILFHGQNGDLCTFKMLKSALSK